MLVMKNYLIKTENALSAVLGYEGENNARKLRIKTTDDLTGIASINLLIGTLDCGQMTVSQVQNYKIIEMVITEEMLGTPGMKYCQLVMKNTNGSMVLKSNQFNMFVRSSNIADRIYVCTEEAIKAALDALIEEGVLAALEIGDEDITTPKIAGNAVTHEKLAPVINDMLGGIFTPINDIEFTNGLYRADKNNGYVVGLVGTGEWRCAVIDASDVNLLRVSIHMYGASDYSIILADENDVMIEQKLQPGEKTPYYVDKYPFIVPPNCTKVYLNDRVIGVTDDKSFKLESMATIDRINSPIIHDLATLGDIIDIEEAIKNGNLSQAEITLLDYGMIGNMGDVISERITQAPNYKHCSIPKTTAFYKISTYTTTSNYYPYFILGVDKNGKIVYQNGDNTTGGQREFYVYLPDSVTDLYVTGSNNGTITVWEVEPMSIPQQFASIEKKYYLKDGEIAALKTIIALNRDNRLLNFAFITDTHSNQYDASSYIASLKRISKSRTLDAIFHGGDVLSTVFNGVPVSLDEYFEAELDAINDYTEIDGIVFVKGNHDNGHDPGGTNNISKPQYNFLFGDSLNGFVKNDSDDGHYGYKDFPKMKIRLIVLESFKETGGEGTSVDQDNWLEEVALDLPGSGWGVIVLTHYLSANQQYDSVRNILSNFSETNTLIAVICGHNHAGMYTTEYGFNLIGVKAGFNGYSAFTVDTYNQILHETRVGIGESRDFHYGAGTSNNYQII